MLDIVFLFIWMIPVYILMILGYFFPKESMLWGKRWAFKEEPEVSDAAIRYMKITSIFGVSALTLIFVIAIATKI